MDTGSLILRKVIYTPHKTPYRFDEAMLASGFTAAPVSQCLFFGVIASSILVSITDAKYLFYIQVVPHLWPYRQAWRVLVWQVRGSFDFDFFFCFSGWMDGWMGYVMGWGFFFTLERMGGADF